MTEQNIDKSSGWLCVNKPAGLTSRKVLNILNREYGFKKSGYAGTLDPFATGVLPIAIGRATKVLEYFMETDKEYSFTVQFGIKTDTGDITGQVTEEVITKISEEEVSKVLPELIGQIKQVPPRYSAIKVGGRRAYDMARSGEEFELKSRLIDIFDLKLIAFDPITQQAKLWVNCGKGTYIRSLAEQIAAKLGVIATTIQLCRDRVGKFNLENAFSLEKLKFLLHNAELEGCFSPVDYVLDDIPAIKVFENDLQRLKSGQAIEYVSDQDLPLVRLLCGDMFVALGKLHSHSLKTIKIIEI